MKKFEYKVFSTLKSEAEKEKLLNELGQQGWELVNTYAAVLYLKREIQ